MDYENIQVGVYFAIKGKSNVRAILPFGEPDWLNWSCDEHVTLNP